MDTNVPHRDWRSFTKEMGAVIFQTVNCVEQAVRPDGAVVGCWDHNSSLGWIRSSPGPRLFDDRV